MQIRMIEINKGKKVGGPFDGKDGSFVFYPREYPDRNPPPRLSEIIRCFSKQFPEGAIYHWNKEKKEWNYKGMCDEELQEGARQLLDAFGVEPAPEM